MKIFPQACHNCGGQIEEICGYQKLPRVTSDARPWRSGGYLMICQVCGLVQAKIDSRWKIECERIYGKYQIYRQADGAEQSVFVGNESVPRSCRLVNWLMKTAKLPTQGRILDYGCGNGAFLRAFQLKYPKWELYGTEYDARNFEKLKEIPSFRKLYFAGEPLPKHFFDFITMIHVLEHLPEPSKVISGIRQTITPNGSLLLQVPDAKENPLITVVADHASHFTEKTFSWVCFKSGLKKAGKQKGRPVSRELTYLGRFCERTKWKVHQNTKLSWQTSVRKIISYVKRAAKHSKQEKLVVFGSSIGAAWFYGVCRGRVRCFLDEDPLKIGKKHLKRPIFSLAEYCKMKTKKAVWIPSTDINLSKKIKRSGLVGHSIL